MEPNIIDCSKSDEVTNNEIERAKHW